MHAHSPKAETFAARLPSTHNKVMLIIHCWPVARSIQQCRLEQTHHTIFVKGVGKHTNTDVRYLAQLAILNSSSWATGSLSEPVQSEAFRHNAENTMSDVPAILGTHSTGLWCFSTLLACNRQRKSHLGTNFLPKDACNMYGHSTSVLCSTDITVLMNAHFSLRSLVVQFAFSNIGRFAAILMTSSDLKPRLSRDCKFASMVSDFSVRMPGALLTLDCKTVCLQQSLYAKYWHLLSRDATGVAVQKVLTSCICILSETPKSVKKANADLCLDRLPPNSRLFAPSRKSTIVGDVPTWKCHMDVAYRQFNQLTPPRCNKLLSVQLLSVTQASPRKLGVSGSTGSILIKGGWNSSHRNRIGFGAAHFVHRYLKGKSLVATMC